MVLRCLLNRFYQIRFLFFVVLVTPVTASPCFDVNNQFTCSNDWWKTVTAETLKHIELADLQAKGSNSTQAIHFIVSYSNDVRVLETVIAAGVDVNARDKFLRTPLHFAVLLNPNPAITKALIKAGADVMAEDRYGNIPLEGIGSKNISEVAEALILAGSAVDHQDKDGVYLIHGLLQQNVSDVILSKLLKTPVDIHVLDAHHQNALFYATDIKHIQMLLAEKVDPTVRNDRGETPLYSNINLYFDSGIIPLYAATKLNFNNQDEQGQTILHRAILENVNHQMFARLVMAGVDTSIKDNDGNTVMMLAEKIKAANYRKGIIYILQHVDTLNKIVDKL